MLHDATRGGGGESALIELLLLLLLMVRKLWALLILQPLLLLLLLIGPLRHALLRLTQRLPLLLLLRLQHLRRPLLLLLLHAHLWRTLLLLLLHAHLWRTLLHAHLRPLDAARLLPSTPPSCSIPQQRKQGFIGYLGLTRAAQPLTMQHLKEEGWVCSRPRR